MAELLATNVERGGNIGALAFGVELPTGQVRTPVLPLFFNVELPTAQVKFPPFTLRY